MRIFITGLAGFLASHLADALEAMGHRVYGCDIVPDENKLRMIDICDCRDFSGMKQRMAGMDVVVHCAALAHEGLSVFSPSVITDSVYGASVSVFSAAIAAGVKRIVYTSSMSRYGALQSPFLETYNPRPVDPYGIAKLAAERTLECLAKVHGVEYAIAVPHNIIGPRQCRSDPYRNVVAIMMNLILQGKSPIIYGDGLQRRCFSYISDVVPCLVKLAVSNDQEILGQPINIGPDTGEVSINELFGFVRTEMGWTIPPIYYPDRPCEVRVANCDANLSRRLLQYHPETSLQEGIAKMAEWMRKVGPKDFDYRLPIEIERPNTPRTWTHKEI